MKQLAFRLNEETEKTEAYLVEHKGLQEDGSVIHINSKVLETAGVLGKIKSKYFGRGTSTVFYEFEGLTIALINDEAAIVLDQQLIENEPIGLTFAKARKSIALKKAKSAGDKKDRKIPRISMAYVKHRTKDGNIGWSTNYSTSLPGVLWNIKLGNIRGLVLVNNECYDTVDMDVHHIYAPWDNRLASTILLTEEEHKQYHKVNGKQRHDVYVNITTVEELEAFVEFMTKL